jgi:NAD(P)-dependent dehydrogenase (short-subunit alcohol dehydrogenase family)
MQKWTPQNITSMAAKLALITDGHQGVGLAVAQELVRHGARVIICADDILKAQRALLPLRLEMDQGLVSFERVDLSDLSSIKKLSTRIARLHERVDYLINNSIVPAAPHLLRSTQGVELTFAKNFLGHFALTGVLLPLIKQSPCARIIFRTTADYDQGFLDFLDLNATHFYDPRKAYYQSQLALVVFAQELHRRLTRCHLQVKSIAVHSGLVTPKLFHKPPSHWRPVTECRELAKKIYSSIRGPNLNQESWPVLFALSSSQAESGALYGPQRMWGKLAYPVEEKLALKAKNLRAAEKLWDHSQELLGPEFSRQIFSDFLPFNLPEKLALVHP